MTWGLFSDEGCVEGDFFSEDAARLALTRYSDEDGLRVAECCHDHPEEEREHCQECNQEEDAS